MFLLTDILRTDHDLKLRNLVIDQVGQTDIRMNYVLFYLHRRESLDEPGKYAANYYLWEIGGNIGKLNKT